MKSSTPMLALAVALLIGAAPSLADDTKPAVLEIADTIGSDVGWDDDKSDEPSGPKSPTIPSQSGSRSDVEVVPPGVPSTKSPLPRRQTTVPSVPNLFARPALDEAYEDIVDETVGLVFNPNSALLSRNSCCLPAPWAHRTGVFGEYLFLRPRSTDLSYTAPLTTLPVSGGGTITVPSGRVGNLDPNYSSGFRVGMNRAIDEFASIRTSYTYYYNSARDSVTAQPGVGLSSLVSYPGLLPSGSSFVYGQAGSSLNFQFADVELRKILVYGQNHALNYSIGARYAHLSGGLNIEQRGAPGVVDFVTAKSNFDGGGIRFGLDGEHYARRTGLMAYWRGGASFIGGQFREDYTDQYIPAGAPTTVNSHWNGGRLLTILDAEIGVGWSSKSQRMRFRTGYLINGWFNTIGPGSYVGAVQSGNFDHMVKAFSLDGLTASAEYRF